MRDSCNSFRSPIRLTGDERALADRAASADGDDNTSGWARLVLLKAAATITAKKPGGKSGLSASQMASDWTRRRMRD
jgi:hypothetical protein